MFSMKLQTLHDLFVHKIQDLYDAEHQITQAIPQMMEVATSPDLKMGMEKHLEETRGQIKRLEELCREMGIEPQGKTCTGMEGIIEETVEVMQENTPSPALDAALLAGAQMVEHYEIAGYGTAAALAKQMNHTNALKLLLQTLEEEKAEDIKLSELAETKINKEADTQQNRSTYAM